MGMAMAAAMKMNKKIQGAAQRLISAPMNLVQMPFRKKEVILLVEGVDILRKIIHEVLSSQEDYAFQELAKERLLIEEEPSQLAVVDIFVSTVDPLKEPPIVTSNTVCQSLL